MTDMKRLLEEVEELREENRRLTNQNAELTNANRSLEEEKENLQKEVVSLTQKNAGLEMIREQEKAEFNKYLESITKEVGSLKEALERTRQ